jgi:hypothetical protein
MAWNMTLSEADTPRRQTSGSKFLRIAGLLWLVAVLAILIATLLAPHIGRMVDVMLHYTTHRHWTLLTLRPEEAFFDLSTPSHTVQSYYSALYRRDAAAMERLTAGPFRDQMRQRIRYAEDTSGYPAYRSYLYTEIPAPHTATVTEKFHLFWQRGIQFHLEQSATAWHIVGLMLVPQ